jgi:hypothetical protein
MLGFNVGAAELAGFVTSEKDNAPRFFGVPLEHSSSVLFENLLPLSFPGERESWNSWNYRFRQLSIRQAQGPIGATGQIQIVGRQHRSQVMRPVQRFQQVNHALSRAVIQTSRGLVGQQQGGSVG